MTFNTSGASSVESSRNLALLNYALMFAAVFFAGVPALAAVIIAYTQRDSAPEPAHSHLGFQIRSFWVAFFLALLAGICGLAAVIHILASLYGLAYTAGWGGVLHGLDGPADQAVRVGGQGACGVFSGHVDVRKDGDGRDAELAGLDRSLGGLGHR